MSIKIVGGTDPVQVYARPAYGRPGLPFLLANTDTANAVFYSDQVTIDAQSSQIAPQGTVSFDGETDIWVSTTKPAVNVLVDYIPHGVTWTNPIGVQIALNALGLAKDATVSGVAGQVAVTGAPPLVFKNVVDLLVGQSIAAGATLTRPASGNFSINQPGYELFINVGQVGGTAAPISLEMQWFDSFGGSLVDDEIYYFYSGDANGHKIHGRGPTKGDRLVVVIKNYSGASGVSFSYVLLQTSRTFTREFWKTTGQGATAPVFPGFTAATMNIPANVLADNSPTLNPAAQIILTLPMYTGTVRLMGLTGDTTAGNSKWVIKNTSDQVAAAAVVFQGSNGQSGFAPFGVSSLYGPDISLPRSQCQITLINGNSTTNEALTTTIVAQEDRA